MHDAFQVSDKPVVSGLQDRVESLLLYAGRLFIGCQNGSLHIYTLELASESDSGQPTATKERVIQTFSKKSIEQLGVIKETNSLVSLSNGTICLHDIHTFEPQTLLGSASLTKGQANLFAIDTSIQHSGRNLVPETPNKGKARDRSTQGAATPASSRQTRRNNGVTAVSAKSESVQKDVSSPVVLTSLAVACRRRLCLFHWRDGQWQEPKELSLPHQVRSMAYPSPQRLFLGFSTTEYGTVTLPYVRDSSVVESPKLSDLFSPAPHQQQSSLSSSGGGIGTASHALGAIPGLGTLGGLAAKTGGYMGLGGKVEKNLVVKVKSNEVLAIKESTGLFLDGNGAVSRLQQIDFALPPEESMVSWPYILSVLPAPAAVGQLSKQQAQDPLTALPTVHVHSAPTLAPVQAIRVPVPSPLPERPISILDVPPTPVAQSARLLTMSPTTKPTLAIVTNPASENGQTTNTTSDSKIWILSGKSWTAQIDQLISLGEYQQALSLLGSLENADFAVLDAVERSKKLRMLVGLILFLDEKKYDRAIDIFIEENVSPAKVVALFPKDIAGKLHRSREEIEEIWGGRTRAHREAQSEANKRQALARKRSMPIPGAAESLAAGKDGEGEGGAGNSPSQQSSSWRFSPMRRRETSRDDDTVSVKSLASKRSMTGLNASKGLKDSPALRASSTDRDGKEDLSYDKSVDVLMRYLPDRRQQFLRALASLPPHSRPSPSSTLPDPSGTPAEALFALPDTPLASYSPGDLQRVARVVETALFKCYLHAKPGLLGPLCRIENWCEVEEVEELLLQAKKYRELLDLYNGKHMHEKALTLLRRMADESTSDDIRDKVDPTVAYVQKLGPDHLDLIFTASEWVFSLSAQAGLEIFTADIEEVERLPRHAVSNHLAKVAPTAQYAQYLEHIIHNLNESGPEFHERLIEIYLERIKQEIGMGDGKKIDNIRDTLEGVEDFKKLIKFLESSTQYRADRLLRRIGDAAMDEVKAILLGKLGQHDGALQIYVHKLKDHDRAEEYCKRVYDEETSASKRSTIFVTLVHVYLEPYQPQPGESSEQEQDKREDRQEGESKSKSPPLLQPALRLLALHGARMDANHVLEILPPLLTVQELRIFLSKSIRKSISWKTSNKVVRRIRTARMDEVEQTLVDLEGRRVKITDSRLCPQCHKRLGNSVIAIHSPHGEVTHYQCRDKWIETKRHRLVDGAPVKYGT